MVLNKLPVGSALNIPGLRIFSRQRRRGWGGGGVGGEVAVALGHFNKHFVKNTRKRGLTGKHFS